tara:strand:- start:412 stop:654 length:243 start_codon:yes stop_codon:yes gene_type:complete
MSMGLSKYMLLKEIEDLKKELAHYKNNCTIVWMIEDVKCRDDTLTDEQCHDVLYMMEQKHDATIGITWETIDFWIEEVKE